MAERPIYGVVFNPKGVRWNFGDPLAAGDLPSQMKIGRRVAWGKFKLEAHYPNVNPGIDEAGLKHTEVKKGDYDTRKGAQDAFKAKWKGAKWTAATKKAYIDRRVADGSFCRYYEDNSPYFLARTVWDSGVMPGVHLMTKTKDGRTVRFAVAPSSKSKNSLTLIGSMVVPLADDPEGGAILCSGPVATLTAKGDDNEFKLDKWEKHGIECPKTYKPEEGEPSVQIDDQVPPKYRYKKKELKESRKWKGLEWCPPDERLDYSYNQQATNYKEAETTIDITPRCDNLIPLYVDWIRDGSTGQRDLAVDHITRMAQFVQAIIDADIQDEVEEMIEAKVLQLNTEQDLSPCCREPYLERAGRFCGACGEHYGFSAEGFLRKNYPEKKPEPSVALPGSKAHLMGKDYPHEVKVAGWDEKWDKPYTILPMKVEVRGYLTDDNGTWIKPQEPTISIEKGEMRVVMEDWLDDTHWNDIINDLISDGLYEIVGWGNAHELTTYDDPDGLDWEVTVLEVGHPLWEASKRAESFAAESKRCSYCKTENLEDFAKGWDDYCMKCAKRHSKEYGAESFAADEIEETWEEHLDIYEDGRCPQCNETWNIDANWVDDWGYCPNCEVKLRDRELERLGYPQEKDRKQAAESFEAPLRSANEMKEQAKQTIQDRYTKERVNEVADAMLEFVSQGIDKASAKGEYYYSPGDSSNAQQAALDEFMDDDKQYTMAFNLMVKRLREAGYKVRTSERDWSDKEYIWSIRWEAETFESQSAGDQIISWEEDGYSSASMPPSNVHFGADTTTASNTDSRFV
jgi:hypothetical protein